MLVAGTNFKLFSSLAVVVYDQDLFTICSEKGNIGKAFRKGRTYSV